LPDLCDFADGAIETSDWVHGRRCGKVPAIMTPSLSLTMTLLVLLAALMHAGWNVMVKIGNDTLLNMGLTMGLAGVIAMPLLFVTDVPDPASWPYLFGSLMTHLGYYLFLVLAYRHGELSLVYPIARGSAPLLVAVSAWMLPPHEILAGWQMVGVAAISLGILSLAAEKPLTGAHKWEPIVFGLLTGLCIMGYTLCDGLGIRHAGPTEAEQFGYIAWLFALDSPLLVLYCLWKRGWQPAIQYWSRGWKLGLAGGALSSGAYGIAIFAMKSGAFAHVSALRETSVIFAALMSAYLLKERFRARRYASVSLVALGAVLLH
jgi:drug/metabolite transporter (DMT)-like permease